MYIFNKVTVKSQLPKQISKLNDIADNFWWAWNIQFLELIKKIDIDLWEKVDKNPVKFLKEVSQENLEKASKNEKFLAKYNQIVGEFESYMKSKNTWYSRRFPNNKKDSIAYFSAEYGLDQILQIYSGGLGILSGDHLKSASDLGVPLVAIGLLYKEGYFYQKIDRYGVQETEYRHIDISKLPILPVKDDEGNDLKIFLKFPERRLWLKVWKINVGRVSLYLLDSDIEENSEVYRDITKTLYGGNQEMRISQEIVLGMGGVSLLRRLHIEPTIYHMNEGHSSFLIFELIKNIIKDKKVSFDVARDIVSARTVFTTHTPVPAGNDIFPIELVEKYFDGYWTRLGIEKDEFLKMGMKPNEKTLNKFNMGILALKVAGKKNGVSKLHGEVSRQLFAEVWPEILPNESPITYITNGVHTCTWLSQSMKELYNKYLVPYWQDSIFDNSVWKDIKDIPNDELWNVHRERKEKLLKLVRENVTNRLRRSSYSYEEISSIVDKLNPDALTIGFARRFATYKRATLLFRDLERITEILNNEKMPIQIIIAGKAHPADKLGQDLIKYIHELSMKPQFKGKIFLLEDYSMEMSKFLVSGVDVWMNTPRRPMEASGTSGQKAGVNGVINFSVLDGWWAEGYNTKNGWIIGDNKNYDDFEEQDNNDSKSIYNTLENKIIPMYYNRDCNGVSDDWVNVMKESIMSIGGNFSTARMVSDYATKLYIPLCNLYNKYYMNIGEVAEYNDWKSEVYKNWNDIKIEQENNIADVDLDAGAEIEVSCNVTLPNVLEENVEIQVYSGRILEDGTVDNVEIIPMDRIEKLGDKRFLYKAKITFKTGGDFGYTFRAIPKYKMLLDSANLNIIKWMIK